MLVRVQVPLSAPYLVEKPSTPEGFSRSGEYSTRGTIPVFADSGRYTCWANSKAPPLRGCRYAPKARGCSQTSLTCAPTVVFQRLF